MKKSIINFLLFITVANAAIAQVVKPTKVIPVTKLPQQKIKPVLPVVKPEQIQLEDITEWLCPQQLVRGDREFDGHGPKVKCDVRLSLKNNNTEIWAKINFEAKETQPDFSTTKATWDVKVYTTPYGKRIKKIASDVFSRTEFLSPPAGAQFLIPGTDLQKGLDVFFAGHTIASAVLAAHGLPVDAGPAIAAQLVKSYIKGNQVIQTPALEGKLVKFFHIVGDTGGDDISNDDNCNDDTRIEKIEFFWLDVFMEDIK
jgi:hypothetical protein